MDARVQTADRGRETTAEACAIERGMRLLGGKWTGSVLWHLKDEPVRFNDLARMVGGASKRMISERLKHLEHHGLVACEVLDTRPLGVAYRITDRGATAPGFLDALRERTEALEASPPPAGDRTASSASANL